MYQCVGCHLRFPVPVHFLRLPILMFILVASRSVAGSQEDKTEERRQNRGEEQNQDGTGKYMRRHDRREDSMDRRTEGTT